MHASLRTFHEEPGPSTEDEDVKAATYAFGLMGLGKFILCLPAEIAEEEVPRLRATLITVISFSSFVLVISNLPCSP
jgi:CLIP-associating protein 1/2